MRRAWRWALAAAATFAVLAGGGVYLVASEPGLQVLARAAGPLSGGRVQVEGARGRILGPLGVERLRIETATQRIEVDGLRLEWQPQALRAGTLEVTLFAARALRLSATQRPPPPVRPDSLRLPVDVVLHTLDLARVVRTDQAGGVVEFGDVRAALDGRGGRWRLTRFAARAPWAALAAELELGKDAPFVLDGRVEAVRAEPFDVRAQFALAGTLSAPRFDGGLHGADLSVLVRGEAAPFDAVPLRRLLLAGEGIDPRRFIPGAPVADLAFSGIFEGRAGERVFGSFSLVNRLPGRVEEGRLPLAGLTGAVLGDATHAEFSHLALDLGRAGRLDGRGSWRAGRFALTLGSEALDLSGLHRDLTRTRLQTRLTLEGDARRQTLAGTLKESWAEGHFALMHADRVLALTEADFSGTAGRLRADGTLKLDASRAFSVNFDAEKINPARLGAFPRGRLNARGEASGALAPSLLLDMQLDLPPGELEGRPVRGSAKFRVAGAHLSAAQADLDLAGNRLQAQGAWGRVGDRLNWVIDAPALGRLKLGLDGQLQSSGSVSGSPQAPNVSGHIKASELKLLGAWAVEHLDARLDLVARADGPFEGALDARGVHRAGQTLSRIAATLAGRRDAHTLAVSAGGGDWRLRAALAGGLDAENVWQGRLLSAELDGPWPARVLAPAPLLLARDRQRVEGLVVAVAGGRIEVADWQRAGTTIHTRGAVSDLPLAPFAAWIKPPLPVTTDLFVAGNWNLNLDTQLTGEARFERVRGDVRLRHPDRALGLTRLVLGLRAAGGEAALDVEIDTRDAGQARLSGRAPVGVEAGRLLWSRGAPLSWTARLDVPDLRFVKAFLPVGMRLDARLAAQLQGGGSLAAPTIEGRVRADAVRFALPEEGVSIIDGAVELALDGDRVRVLHGELKGPSGRIRLSGDAELRDPRGGLTLVFEQFAASQRSDRRIVMSGTTQLGVADRRLRLTGDLVVDRARLEMPEAGRPALSGDVIIVGRPPREPGMAQRTPLALDVNVGLGEDFMFKGAGLDARLGGRMRVYTVDGELRGEGVIRVVEGRYAAYAQMLVIERGVLRFVGPLDNPGIDVLAVRTTPTVKAGVQVRGTVQQPVVALYSDPDMPDTEKLSWLVLGHGLDRAGQQGFVLMQVAAGALLSQVESVSLQARLAESLGIDSVDVRAGDHEDLRAAIVSVGKRFSSRTILSYEQSLDGLSQAVKVLHQWTPTIRFEARAGRANSLDAFYTREFD